MRVDPPPSPLAPPPPPPPPPPFPLLSGDKRSWTEDVGEQREPEMRGERGRGVGVCEMGDGR